MKDLNLYEKVSALVNSERNQIICNAPLRTSKRKLFDKVEWLTVNQLSVNHTLLLVFKIRQSAEPE